jgi:hypothetical protein
VAVVAWQAGSRAERLRASHSYGFVLALVISLFVVAASLPNERWAGSIILVVQLATLVAAFWTSGLTRAALPFGTPLMAPAVAVAVIGLISGGRAVEAAVAIATGALTVATMVVIGHGVMDQADVNAQSVRGVICVYVLLGLLFVSVYGALAAIGDGPFFAQGTDGTRTLRVYFSFVTLATLGYGDYTPAGDVGHTVAIVEGLLGQLYLVTVVAIVVSQLGRRRHRE